MPSACMHLILVSGLLVSIALTGCAKSVATKTPEEARTPVTVTPAPPTPRPIVEEKRQEAPREVPRVEQAPPVQEKAQEPQGAARPVVSEFKEVPEIKRIYFDFDKYDVRPEDATTLDANARWLKSNDNLVLIEGHSDERGTNEYNLALGERRAKAAMNYLVAQGVPAGRITILSYGEERPFCTAQNESCWSKNRRAAFLVNPR